MMQKKKPKLILLEANDIVRKHTESILSKAGWDVTCKQVSKDALDTLARSKNSLFALFISNFKLPKMEGDDILQKVRSISPLTRRMLVVPVDEPDTLINAINKAKINACIISPFNDEELIVLARNCFKQFKHEIKRQQLQRVTRHQNRQMFKIAKKFKKKVAAYKQVIDEKKAEKLMLKSKKRKSEDKNNLDSNISILHLLEHKNISIEPDLLKNEFIAISKTIQSLFNQVAGQDDSDLVSLDFDKILKRKDQSLTDNKSVHSNLIKKIITQALTRTLKTDSKGLDKSKEPGVNKADSADSPVDELFEVSISEDQTKAYIKKLDTPGSRRPLPDISDVLAILINQQISYGIIDDKTIETWLSEPSVAKILIAAGQAPIQGKNGQIKFYFETDFTNPGKINEDGSIDFRERGETPYVVKTDLLAQKIPSEKSQSGISVSGVPIPVDEVIDPVFDAGPGTEMSEDGLSIHAAIDGQPSLDALGSISVSPELTISGDVDFETGNINFKGNIVVTGIIKEGFTVKGVNLIAKEIEGGIIDLSGDLHVNAGITDSNISTHGNIYAKFINNSDIMSFGNLVISKEIIDSNIMLSGSCQNEAGHIISSKITARLGIEAGKIGTSSSKPVRIKVGVDEHIQILKTQAVESLEAAVYKSNLLKDEIKRLEDEDQELYLLITKKAHIQDRAQLAIKELQNLETGNDKTKEIQKLNKDAKIAEQELNTIFQTQDKIAKKIDQIKNQIIVWEEKIKKLVIEKKALKEFSRKDRPVPIVTIAKTIAQDTIISACNSSIILKEDASRCKIQEIASGEDDNLFYEMNILDL